MGREKKQASGGIPMNTEEVILYPQTEQVMNAFIHQFWDENQ